MTFPVLGRRVVVLASAYAAVWWLLADGDNGSWLLGAPAVALATVVSAYLAREASFQPPRLGGLMRFTVFFLWESLKGGMDVARRAFQPRVALSPDFIEYNIELPAGPARALFAVSVSLLPGTLTADLDGRRLNLHVLDRYADVLDALQKLELHAAAAFGLSLGGRAGGSR